MYKVLGFFSAPDTTSKVDIRVESRLSVSRSPGLQHDFRDAHHTDLESFFHFRITPGKYQMHRETCFLLLCHVSPM